MRFNEFPWIVVNNTLQALKAKRSRSSNAIATLYKLFSIVYARPNRVTDSRIDISQLTSVAI